MIKPTSRAAFDELVNSGTLSKRVRHFLLTMAVLAPNRVSRHMIADAMPDQCSTVAGIANRLISAKIIHVDGTMKCHVTGRTVEALTFGPKPDKRVSPCVGHAYEDGNV